MPLSRSRAMALRGRRERSPPVGYGVCHRHVLPKEARDLGRFVEEWRFRVSDAIRARDHSLGIPQSSDAGLRPVSELADLDIASDIDQQFSEVPADFMRPASWITMVSPAWSRSENILRGEGGPGSGG